MRRIPTVLGCVAALVALPVAGADHGPPPEPIECSFLDGPPAPILNFYPGDIVNDLLCGTHTILPEP